MNCEKDWHDPISTAMQRKNVWEEKKKNTKKKEKGQNCGSKKQQILL